VQPHPQGHPDLSLTHIEEVKYYGGKYGVDPVFLLALMQSESSGRPGAVSSRRAYGLLQITLPTARDYDPEATPARLLDSDYNLEIACRHYRWLRDRIDRYFGHTGEYQRLRITVAAWNAGLQAVLDHGGIPHYPESQLLLSRFEEKYLEYIALGY
jgi:soluble lytic murein transglycosylase